MVLLAIALFEAWCEREEIKEGLVSGCLVFYLLPVVCCLSFVACCLELVGVHPLR